MSEGRGDGGAGDEHVAKRLEDREKSKEEETGGAATREAGQSKPSSSAGGGNFLCLNERLDTDRF